MLAFYAKAVVYLCASQLQNLPEISYIKRRGFVVYYLKCGFECMTAERKDMSDFTVRPMTIEDYEDVSALWHTIDGFAIRSIDDSKEGVETFLKRNPTTSVVAIKEGKLAGPILCGHDGRRGCMYHVCVHKDYRRHGIGKAMVVFCMEALKKEHINKVSLIAFTKNDVGNAFWRSIGWTKREDLNYYDFTLNTENIIAYINADQEAKS